MDMVDIVPPGVSGIDQAHLNRVFTDLDAKIDKLARRVESYKVKENDTSHKNRKCHMICMDKDLDCLRECSRKRIVNMEELRDEFPIDMKRLDMDMELRNHFQRHQSSPSTIQNSEQEAALIADIYAMPISTAAIPDESWEKAIGIIVKYPLQKDQLRQNWQSRAAHYSEEAKTELARKMNRYDTDNTLFVF